MNEVERITKAYRKRQLTKVDSRYSYFRPDHVFNIQQREKQILKILGKLNFNNLSEKKILDVGCGDGSVLRDFIKYGARPDNCFGIDLLPDRIEEAKRISINLDLRCGNAEYLPYDDEVFDIISCFTVFSSILDNDMKQNVAHEMLRFSSPRALYCGMTTL